MKETRPNPVAQMLSDNSGGLSTMRVAFFMWALGVLVTWMIVTLNHQSNGLAEINSTVVTTLGLLAGGKVLQRFGEDPETPSVPPSPTAPASTVDELKKQAESLSAEDKAKFKASLG